MHLNSIKRRLWFITIAICFLFLVTPYSIANEKKRETLRQLNEALANLPQTEAKKKLEDNLQILYNALGLSSQQAGNKDINDLLSHATSHFYDLLSSDSEATRTHLNQWDEHLFSLTRFSNLDYCIAMKSQQVSYYKAIVDLNEKLEEIDLHRKNHSSEWISDLSNRFGKDFVRENRKEILNNFLAIMNRSYRSYEENLKDLIYQEAMLYGSYKEYFGQFLDYYENSLNSEGKKTLSLRKDLAKAILSIIDDVSITNLYETKALYERMADYQAQNQNKALFSFFNELPNSSSINIFEANEDLRKAVRDSK